MIEEILNKCVWRLEAEKSNSTTFKGVENDSPNSKRYECYYGCDGYNYCHNYYIPARFLQGER